MKKLKFFKSKEIKSNLIGGMVDCLPSIDFCYAECGELMIDKEYIDHVIAK